jgi:glutamate-1-semialdehyde 2,1-aminomutase
MSKDFLSNSEIVATYRTKTPGSEKLAYEAEKTFPSGITHDGRYLLPYGVYISRAKGSRKWDVDGNEYVDYFGGHGALLLGHNHPTVTAAVHRALDNGTHFGSNHPLEIRWAELVQALIPCAERVRFTSSGTEATHLAVRLARAFTGKKKILRFLTHFHGWHDHMSSGFSSHFDGSPTIGVLPSVAENVVLLKPNDVEALRLALSTGEVAAVILEPTGSQFGHVPIVPDFLKALRKLTLGHRVVLIFDEVVTGFRVSQGGAQKYFNIIPDLVTLAKILAGGLPGGAVAGRKDIMDLLDFEMTENKGLEKIVHYGTYNANPVAAAAGIAAIETVATTDAIERANASANLIRMRLNEVLEAEKVPWAVYGTFSGFHIFTNPKKRKITPATFNPLDYPYDELKLKAPHIVDKIRLGMLIHGVDLNGWPGGLTSAFHAEEDVAKTLEGFRRTLAMLKMEGDIGEPY